MNLLLFFDGVGGYYSGSSGPASNSNGRRNTNNTIYAFRFTPDAVSILKSTALRHWLDLLIALVMMEVQYEHIIQTI